MNHSANPETTGWEKVLRLVQDAFAYMEPIMGFPPRTTSMTPETLADRAAAGTAWVINPDDPIACLFMRPSNDIPGALFLSMLAVRADHQGTGLAAELLQRAEDEARALGFSQLTLDTGSALTDLRRRYVRWGWTETRDDGEIVTFIKSLHPAANAATPR